MTTKKATLKAIAKSRAGKKRQFDESQVERYPKGHPQGGQFKPERTRPSTSVPMATPMDALEVERRAESFNGSPDSVQRLVERRGHPKPLIGTGGQAYFTASQGILIGSYGVGTPGESVYRHEYGHFLDYTDAPTGIGTWSGTDPEFQAAFKKESLSEKSIDNYEGSKLAKTVSETLAYIKETADPAIISVFSTQHHLQDIVSAMSGGYVERGHSPSYYSQDGRRETEIFANFFDFYSSPVPEFRELPKRIAPKMWSLFVKRMKELENG